MNTPIKSTPAQIKKAIDAIYRLAIATYPSTKLEEAARDAEEYLNSIEPEVARAAYKLADTLIENAFNTDEDED